jgi:hypothetical protein
MKIEKRWRSDVSLLVAYTLSKAYTNTSNGTGIFNFNQPSIQNYYDMSSEKAVAPIDVPQRVVVSYTWDLPFAKMARGATRILLGGWQLNGLTTIQGGTPIALTTQVNQVNAFNGTSRPNIALGQSAKLPEGERTIDQWFRTDVFSQPAAFTFGGVSPRLPDTRAPGLVNFDLSAFKNTPISERVNLQLRFEFFNAFNHPNFGPPAGVVGNAQLGVISSADPARVVQVAAKIIF